MFTAIDIDRNNQVLNTDLSVKHLLLTTSEQCHISF